MKKRAKKTINTTFNERELATILAALRCYQATDDGHGNLSLYDIATNGGTLDALTLDEIDELCERINFPDEGAPHGAGCAMRFHSAAECTCGKADTLAKVRRGTK